MNSQMPHTCENEAEMFVMDKRQTARTREQSEPDVLEGLYWPIRNETPNLSVGAVGVLSKTRESPRRRGDVTRTLAQPRRSTYSDILLLCCSNFVVSLWRDNNFQ